jgi:threonine/homoserine/homoserine lactone efflux protein
MTDLFFAGFVIGFSIAAPVGPIGVLCISRTLSRGLLSGLVTGLAAATADGLYGSVAAFGLTSVSDLLISYKLELRLIGGIFLIVLGARAFLASRGLKRARAHSAPTLSGDYLSGFFLTITNPITIVVFAAIFAGFGLGLESVDYCSSVGLTLGVFMGSLAWWIILGVGVFIISAPLGGLLTRYSNPLSGSVLIVFGLISLISAFK